jgi:endonuclease G
MKKILIFLALLTQFVKAQTIDTVVVNNVFTSYYSFVTHNPVIVTYTLNYIDGNCDRSQYDFKHSKEFCDSGYVKSGFDKGHLCNVEDFSSNCDQAKLTFSYYNCAPQTQHCNRSSWKKLENMTRLLATDKNVLVINGVICESTCSKLKCMWTPSYFYKLVVNQTTNKLVMIAYVKNDLVSAPYYCKIEEIYSKLDKQHKILLRAILSNVSQ